MKVLVLLSGGLDSATVLAMYRGHERLAVGFDYGQPHAIELDYASAIAKSEGLVFEQYHLPLIAQVDDVVFAGRNAVLLSVATSIAVARGFDSVAIGCNATDWERFPDCRPDFMRAMGEVLKTYGVGLLAPLLRMTKADVVDEAKRLRVGATWSCYAPTIDAVPCGVCLACKTRAEAGA